MINNISNYSIDRELKAMSNGNFKLSEILDGSYEKKVRELLDKLVAEREKFENLTDLDKLVAYMMDKRIPQSAQARNFDDRRDFNEKKETRKLTREKAVKVLEIVNNDYDKAIELVNTMA